MDKQIKKLKKAMDKGMTKLVKEDVHRDKKLMKAGKMMKTKAKK